MNGKYNQYELTKTLLILKNSTKWVTEKVNKITQNHYMTTH